MSLIQKVKDRLVEWGSRNPLTQTALRCSLAAQGFKLQFRDEYIAVARKKRTILLKTGDLSFVPEIANLHEHFFEVLVPAQDSEERLIIDFSKPGPHTYRRTGIELIEPGIAEDDAMPDYTRWFTPAPGMRIFDIGAHAGLTTIELARMVEPGGSVVAFEPDDSARDYLRKNLTKHGIGNVEIESSALGEESGHALFSMDGTQAAGFVDSVVYARRDQTKTVPVLSLEDAVARYGLPDFMKLDIEGAELPLIRGARHFLQFNLIPMAMETHRLKDESFTHDSIVPMLQAAGYEAKHVVLGVTQQNFVFARPWTSVAAQPVDRATAAS